jgi:glutamate carboxypeptidase
MPLVFCHVRWGIGPQVGERAAAGLACVDSLGPRGDLIHSPEEFVYLDSLAERARLTALFLMKLAAGEARL